MKVRNGEQIGGGWLVFRRDKKTGRVATPRSCLPFEHPTLDSAVRAATSLSEDRPGESFEVFHTTGIVARFGKSADGDEA